VQAQLTALGLDKVQLTVVPAVTPSTPLCSTVSGDRDEEAAATSSCEATAVTLQQECDQKPDGWGEYNGLHKISTAVLIAF